MKFFDGSRPRAVEDFRAYAAERAIAFKDLEAIEKNARRLSILDPLVAGKRLAYIGESDHFIHEKYAYRLAMLNYLAARGFRNVGEELGATDGIRIARYVETGNESQLERVSIYGYSGATRTDRDDTPTGILRGSFGDAYPTALFAAEQKRFAHGLRKIGVRFFGFDIDPYPAVDTRTSRKFWSRCRLIRRSIRYGRHCSASRARRSTRKSRGSTTRSN
ncbi:hypothetical protein [Candidatus Binatus sp.]|uniref:hypothetical protein n=1 Tax=Candidatus Binatus sp. TaxID=2811406 RepID=UPI003BAFC399